MIGHSTMGTTSTLHAAQTAKSSMGATTSVKLTDPEEFEAIFNLLGASQSKKLKLQVPDTVFLSANTEYVAVTSIVSSCRKDAVVKRWAARQVNMKALWTLAKQWCTGAAYTGRPVAVARYVNGSFLLDSEMLDELLQAIMGLEQTGILNSQASAPPQLETSAVPVQKGAAAEQFLGGIPFCLQEYVQPLEDARYVTSFQWSDILVVCESFRCSHSDTYLRVQEMVKCREGNVAGMRQRNRQPGLQGAELHTQRLRQLTLAVVNYIHRAHKCQLLGLVVEVVEDAEKTLWLQAVLGTCWPEQWARRGTCKDGNFSAEVPRAVQAAILGPNAQKLSPSANNEVTAAGPNAPPRNSDRYSKGVLQVVESGSVYQGPKSGRVQHREPWYSPRSQKTQTRIDKAEWAAVEEAAAAEASASALDSSTGGMLQPQEPPAGSPRKAPKASASPRAAKFTIGTGSPGGTGKPGAASADPSEAGDRAGRTAAAAELQTTMPSVLPQLALPEHRDALMHVTTGPQVGNRNFLYRKEVAESDPGVRAGQQSTSGAGNEPRTASNRGQDLATDLATSPLSAREVYFKEKKAAAGYGIHSDVALMLSPRHTEQAAWALGSAATLTSPAMQALAASGAVMLRAGRVPPSFAIGSDPSGGSTGKAGGRGVADITVRLTRRVEELRQALQEQCQEAAASRIAEVNAVAKQKLAEAEREKVARKLSNVEVEYLKFKGCINDELQALREERDKALGSTQTREGEQEALRQKLTETKERLDKERELAFDITAELREQLGEAKTALDNHGKNLDATIRDSETEKNLAKAELTEERAKTRTLNKSIKYLEEMRDALQLELMDERKRLDKSEFHKETMMRAIPELHLVMQTLQEDVYASVQQADVADLLADEDNPNHQFDIVNKVLGRNTLTIRQVFLFYCASNSTGRRRGTMSQGEFVKFCRDCSIIETQMDRVRAFSKVLSRQERDAQDSDAATAQDDSLKQDPRESGKGGEGGEQGVQDVDIAVMKMLCQDVGLEHLGDPKLIPCSFLRPMDLDHIFVKSVSSKTAARANEGFMELDGFVQALVRIAYHRFPKVGSASARLVALWFQTIMGHARKVTLSDLMTFDRESHDHGSHQKAAARKKAMTGSSKRGLKDGSGGSSKPRAGKGTSFRSSKRGVTRTEKAFIDARAALEDEVRSFRTAQPAIGISEAATQDPSASATVGKVAGGAAVAGAPAEASQGGAVAGGGAASASAAAASPDRVEKEGVSFQLPGI